MTTTTITIPMPTRKGTGEATDTSALDDEKLIKCTGIPRPGRAGGGQFVDVQGLGADGKWYTLHSFQHNGQKNVRTLSSEMRITRRGVNPLGSPVVEVSSEAEGEQDAPPADPPTPESTEPPAPTEAAGAGEETADPPNDSDDASIPATETADPTESGDEPSAPSKEGVE